MVSVATMFAGLSAITTTTVSASLTSLPTFDIPAFDYNAIQQGDIPARVLQALQTDGIIALKNIPNYANLRERYLVEAAQCAALNADNVDTTNFVSRKLFADGTNRMTISTNAGRELAGSAIATDAACPGYRALYEEFSATMERAVNTFGSALDQTSFTASDGEKRISSRQLVGEAVRLDHFHAYEAAAATVGSTSTRALSGMASESDMSLPLHEDHGLFIAMSAPKFFEVADGDRQLKLVERALAADASGLIIQTANGARVRPVLKADEVVIMMGTGASRWLQTSHALPAVLHGMRMPDALVASAEAGRRSLRTWFGKMTLLPSYQRMLLSTGKASFDEHVNATTRHLVTNDASELKAIGCATGRHLEASEGKCTTKTCTLKAGASAPEESCSVICNREGHNEDDAPTCAEKCSCTEASAGERCWMLCVANLPSATCALDKQTCSGQELKCSATPTPTTVTPTTTPASTTKAPGPTTTTDAPSTTTSGTTTESPQATSSPSPSEPSDSSSSSSDASEADDDTVSSPSSPVPSTSEPSSASTLFVATSVAATVIAASAALL